MSSSITKKKEYYYIREDGKTVSNNLEAIESFSASTSDKNYVGVYIDTNDSESGAFHLFELDGLKQIFEVATFKFKRYDETSLVELEETCAKYTDATLTLNEASDTLDILMNFLEKEC